MNEQPNPDRRSFLKTMGASSALAAAVPALWRATTAEAGAVTPDFRAVTPGKYGIELDGVFAGWVQSLDGGGAEADVIVEKLGSGQLIAKKHIGGVKYEDITVSCGTGMSKAFYDWIKNSMDGKPAYKNGAIRGSSFQKYRLNFANALITEIGFPALDAASKDAAKMTIKFSPEYTRRVPDTANLPNQSSSWQWLASRFSLEIDGLDCSRVNKIEALVVKQKVIENPVGGSGGYQLEPASLEVPDLIVTLPESAASTFLSWFDDFVVKGNNGDDKERGGILSWLTSDGRQTIGTLQFQHLGIFGISPDTTGTDGVRRVKCEMYCEQMAFSFSASSA